MKKGDKYQVENIDFVFTAKSFRGEDGKEYETLNEAKQNNPDDRFLIVKNKEFSGFSRVDKIKPIQND